MKKIIVGIILSGLIIVGASFLIINVHSDKQETTETASSEMIDSSQVPVLETTEEAVTLDSANVTTGAEKVGTSKFVKTILFDVPAEDHSAEPSLKNGGAVTALSMLLRYYLIPTDKNEVADKMATSDSDDLDKGFSGNMQSGKAIGVNIGPLAEVAQAMVGESSTIVSGKELAFSDLLDQVQKDRPILVIVPAGAYAKAGNKKLVNDAVVIVGMDQKNIIINTPDGKTEAKINTDELKKQFEKADGQALYLQN